MRHKLLVLTVKNFLQSVYICGSYRKIKTGVPFFGPPGMLLHNIISIMISFRVGDWGEIKISTIA